jgi:hypothetical protein
MSPLCWDLNNKEELTMWVTKEKKLSQRVQQASVLEISHEWLETARRQCD